MLLTEKKWPNPKESLLMKDAEKLFNSKEKSVKAMTNLLLSSTKKVLTQSAWKPLPIKKLLP